MGAWAAAIVVNATLAGTRAAGALAGALDEPPVLAGALLLGALAATGVTPPAGLEAGAAPPLHPMSNEAATPRLISASLVEVIRLVMLDSLLDIRAISRRSIQRWTRMTRRWIADDRWRMVASNWPTSKNTGWSLTDRVGATR
jgi:hypothetical protein